METTNNKSPIEIKFSSDKAFWHNYFYRCSVENINAEIHSDGEIVVKTGYYKWQDDTIRNIPEPKKDVIIEVAEENK